MTPDLLLRSYKVADSQKANVSVWKRYKSLLVIHGARRLYHSLALRFTKKGVE